MACSYSTHPNVLSSPSAISTSASVATSGIGHVSVARTPGRACTAGTTGTRGSTRSRRSASGGGRRCASSLVPPFLLLHLVHRPADRLATLLAIVLALADLLPFLGCAFPIATWL